jgi:hypothetical protein
MRKWLHRLLPALFGLGFIGCSASEATTGSANGTVYNITTQGNFFLFQVTGTHINNPACSTTQRWALSVASAGGQTMAAQLLTAYSLGKVVSISGDGTCTIYGDSENVFYVLMP